MALHRSEADSNSSGRAGETRPVPREGGVILGRVIVGGSSYFIEQVKRTSLEIPGEATTPQGVFPLVEQLAPDAVLTEVVNRDWLETACILAGIRKNIRVFVSGDFGMEQWREIRRAGCIAVSSDPEQAAGEVSAATAGLGGLVFRHDDRPAPEIEAQKVDVVRGGLIIAVFGIKGGIGKTEIALNLAATVGLWAKNLSRSQGQEFKVLLLDYNSDYGTSKVNLGLYSRVLNANAPKVYSVGDMDDPALGSRWDDLVARLNYYKKANLYFLAPPQAPEERVGFDADLARRIINLTENHFDLIVIDLGTGLDKRDQAMVALGEAKKLIYVVEPFHTVVTSNAEFVKTEMRDIVDMSKVSMVVNHAHPPNRAKQTYTPAEVVRSLGLPLLGSLPYEPRITEGVPHICVDQRSPFSRSIVGLARSVLGSASIEIAPPKRFFNIFGIFKTT